MKGIQVRVVRRFITGMYAGFAALTIALSVLTGCSTVETVKAPAAPEPVADQGHSVMRLEDGRKGFIITEVPNLDEVSRRDFDNAVTMLKNEDYGKAIELLEKVIEQSPGITAPYIDIAIAFNHIGKLEQAEENLQAALKLFPGHPVASNEYGLLYRKTGRFAEAREMYEKALNNFPDYYPLHRNLAILCDLYQDDLTCALEHYEIYSNAKPEDKQVKIWIADVRARLGQQ